MMAWIVILALVLALLGVPLFIVLFGAALLGMATTGLAGELVWVEVFQRLTSTPLFVAVPLFCQAGFVLSESGAARRLVELSRALLGWLPGGAGITTLAAAAFFTAFTGASGVTIVALGGLLLPVLRREGYGERFNLGLLTTCGSVGLLFPPSLPIIVTALVLSASVPVAVETLFLACLVPGLVLMAVLAAWGLVLARRTGEARERFDARRVGAALLAARCELPIPLIIVVGFFGGWLTITEVAAVVATWTTLSATVLRRELDTRRLADVTVRALVLAGAILAIIMAALALSNWLTDREVPQRLLAVLEESVESRWTFLLLLNLFLLAVGCMMDVFSALLIVVPITAPIALAFGVDPVHFAVIVLLNLEIGYSTPPVGMNLFIASLRFRRPVLAVYRASLPFIALMLGVLALVTWWPALSMTLVRHVEGSGSVEVRWAPLDDGADGRGRLRWALRAVPGDLDATLPPPAGAPERELTGLRVTVRPEETGGLSLALLVSGDDGSASAVWRTPAATVEALSPDTTRATRMHTAPPRDETPFLITREKLVAAAAVLETIENGRVTGAVLATFLHFPDDPDAPEEVLDVEFRFEAPLVAPNTTPKPPPASASRFTVHDVVVEETPTGRMLRRLRTRPHDVRAHWNSAGAVTGVKLKLEGVEGWPGEDLVCDAAIREDDGTILAILRGEQSGRLWSVSLKHDR